VWGKFHRCPVLEPLAHRFLRIDRQRSRKMAASSWKLIRGLVLVAALLMLHAGAARGDDWTGWRGPQGTGVTREKDFPTSWNVKTGENIVWKAALENVTGHSSPIVYGDKVFLTTSVRQNQQQQDRKEIPSHHLRCFSAADGKLLWQTEIAPGKENAGQDIYAAPTPVTDGKAVYCWFGSAVAAAVDLDGKLLWRAEQAGPYKVNPGICSSPALFGDTVLLLCDQGSGSGWLRALDKKTGQVAWEKKREKTSITNASPILVDLSGKPQLVVQASDRLEGLDPHNGEPLWWCKATGFGASPAIGDGMVYCDSGKDESGLAVRLGGQGDVSATHVAWQADKILSQYQSAVICRGIVFHANKPGIIRALELKSGKELAVIRAPGVATVCSPVATAGDCVYFASADKTYVVSAVEKPKILAASDLSAGGNSASAAFANGKIFIRGDGALFCIGNKPAPAKPPK
jgi:outer membrane protein assembly factor BamB